MWIIREVYACEDCSVPGTSVRMLFPPPISIEANFLLNSLSHCSFEFVRSIRFDSKKSCVSNTCTFADVRIRSPREAKRSPGQLCLA